MDIQVGDKVKIKDNLKEIEDFAGRYVPELEKYVGKVCTIEKIINKGKTVAVKENRWSWDIRAIEKIECKFTKSDLKDGDIVTYRDGGKRIKINNELKSERGFNLLSNYKNDLTDKNNDKDLDIIKVERPVQYKTVFEHKEEILDEAEKRYLSAVIRPYRSEVTGIEKENNYDGTEYIAIYLEGNSGYLPDFKKGTMYKNMEVDKAYTLEELGL